MPDLEIVSVLDWLRQEEPDCSSALEQPVTSAEAHPEVADALIRLGQALDDTMARDRAGLAAHLLSGSARDGLRTTMGQLGLPRTLRLLDWIMRAGLPDSDVIVAALLEPGPPGTGQYLQAALAEVARQTLVERIYAPARLASLMAACVPADGLREVA